MEQHTTRQADGRNPEDELQGLSPVHYFELTTTRTRTRRRTRLPFTIRTLIIVAILSRLSVTPARTGGLG